MDQFGVKPKPLWPVENYGGRKLGDATNIFFTNGGYDPWQPQGVLPSRNNKTGDGGLEALPVRVIPAVGHHVDLLFTHPLDTVETKATRLEQLAHITAWIKQAYS